MSDLGSLLGKIAGKVLNAANSDRSLKCLGCQEITSHIAISYADYFRSKEDWGLFDDVLGVVSDINPLNPTVMGNPYACKKCKRIRCEGGLMSNEFNKSVFYL